jgi:hypothetical protein
MQWIAETIYSILRWRAFPPRYMLRSALEMLRQSAEVLQSLSAAPDGRAVWNELQNKIEAFSLFEYADSELGVTGKPDLSLQEIVLRAFQLGPYRSVWAMEGVGRYYANLHSFPGQIPDKLLCEENTRGLPTASLIPLHTGMGLALAECALELLSRPPANDFRLIDKFAQLCRDNSRDGYAGAAFEALGLVARNLYPQLIAGIDSYLSRDGVLLAYFWHGIGRGIYFNPGNFPPFCSAPWTALEMCRCEPHHETGKRNAMAGLAWALTLVNIRHPEIISTFLRYHGAEVAQDDAFANGVRSATVVWRDISPGDFYLDALQTYVPDDADSFLLELWNRCVAQSCLESLSYQRVPVPKRAISDVFCYHSAAFIDQPQKLV